VVLTTLGAVLTTTGASTLSVTTYSAGATVVLTGTTELCSEPLVGKDLVSTWTADLTVWPSCDTDSITG